MLVPFTEFLEFRLSCARGKTMCQILILLALLKRSKVIPTHAACNISETNILIYGAILTKFSVSFVLNISRSRLMSPCNSYCDGVYAPRLN